jgi:hypothetical protein
LSDQVKIPEFDNQFWATVDSRVEQVRDLTVDELRRAEHDLLAEQLEAEVVPVFPGPFWNRVNKRAASVREMALYELTDAEERLVNGPESGRAAWRNRVAVPAFVRRMPRLRPFGVPLGARINTIGFVTAVLAVLLLLPQIAPIASLADVGKPRGPLAIFFSADPEDEDAPSSQRSGASETGAEGSKAKESKTDGKGNPSTTKSPVAGSTSKSSTSGEPGATGQSSSADSGTPAVSGTPTAGTAAGEDGADSAPGLSAAVRPAAPSNLLVTAIDDTSVRLRWRDQSDNESGFVIERSGDPAERRTTESNQKGFIWTGLTPNSEACFKVRARNEAGVSPWSPTEANCVRTYESQPVGGPVVLQALACSNEGTLVSVPDVQETEITFRNLTGRAVKIFELGQEGVRELTPIRLEAGASTTVNTFLGNPYVVTGDDEAAGCMALFLGRSWTSVANITETA